HIFKQFQIRGVSFRLTIKGVNNTAEVRDTLRFLVIRQRIPHCILSLPFEWQQKSRSEVVTNVSKHPFYLMPLCWKF
uniref:Ovule protein n=1 Tax=Syphacia muris TaxID=451379 RepID=A0A0N5ACM0_9BILA